MRSAKYKEIESLLLEERGFFLLCNVRDCSFRVTSEAPILYESYKNLENDEMRKELLSFYYSLEGFPQKYFSILLKNIPFSISIEKLIEHQKPETDEQPNPNERRDSNLHNDRVHILT